MTTLIPTQPSSQTTTSTSTSSSSSSTYTSLLSPPNPALELTQPPGSILINRNDPSCLPPDQLAAQLNPGTGGRGRGVASAIKSSFSINNAPGGGSGSGGGTRRPGPPAAVFNRRARASSVTAASSSPSASTSGSTSGSNLYRSGSGRSPLVSFAPLPPVPDLERRRSITLGIAARSNLLKTQGGARSGAGAGGAGAAGAGGGAGGRKRTGGSQVLMMTDEEWEEYKRNIQQRNAMSNQNASSSNSQDPPEIHRLVKRGTKKLWKKARSMSSSSSTSSSGGGGRGDKAVGVVPTSPGRVAQPGLTGEAGNGTGSGTGMGLSVPTQDPAVAAAPNSPGGRTRNGLISRIRESSASSSSSSIMQLQAQRPSSPPAGRSLINDSEGGGGMMVLDDDDEDAIMSDPEMDDNENAIESGSGSEYDLSSSYGSSSFGSGGMGDLSERVILEHPEEDELDEMDQDQEVDDEIPDEDEDEDRSSTSSSSIRSAVETPDERRRQEEEDEMKDAGEIPAYLRRDSAAEQFRYQHLHDLVQEGASTPKERREGLLSHSGLTDRLRALQVEGKTSSREGSPDRLGGSRAGDGDETPKGRTSPKAHSAGLPPALA